MRAAVWRLFCMRIGSGTQLLGGVVILCPSGVSIGKRVTVNVGCRFDGNGGLTIGDDVLFGPNCQILTANHRFSRHDIPMKYQGIDCKSVEIGNDVWFGVNVIILPGIRIGDGVIIGAGAVVTSDIAPFTIVAGVPARPIGLREKAQTQLRSQ